MDSQPSRRLLAVAGIIGACVALILGLVWWRAPRLAAMTPRPVLADDVERWFAPGAIGREVGGRRAEDGGRKAEDGGLSSDVSRLPSAVGHPSSAIGRPFLTRALGGVDKADGGAWARFNGLTPRLNFSHNLGRVFPPELYDTHPEFFPLEGEKRLQPPTGAQWWNPDLGRADVAAYAAGKAREFFAKNPDAVSFALGVNDGLVFGESPETVALTTPVRWFRERPDYSNLVFTFMNRAAADLATTHPDKYLGALAYYWTENTPDFPVHPQVIPFLTADRSQGYDRGGREEERALQARWVARMTEDGGRRPEAGGLFSDVSPQSSVPSHPSSAIGPQSSALSPQSSVLGRQVRLGLYDYLYGHGFLIPRIHTWLIAENLREARRLGFTDYFAEMTPNWGLDGPQPWLVAQLLQDPEQSERRLLAEYYRRYFRESAFLMQRFFERCEEQWMDQAGRSYWLKHFRNESQAAVFPSAVCRELKGILDAALAQAKSDTVRIRVGQVSDAFGVTQRFVAMQEAREALNRAALAENVSPATVAAALDRFQIMRESFVSYTKRLQREQPLLVAPFTWDDYLRHDPTANAAARLIPSIVGPDLGPRLERVDGNGAQSGVDQGPALHSHTESVLSDLRAVEAEGEELLANGNFAGPVQPARQIAGLTYGVALPAPWIGRVEPAEHHLAGLKTDEPGVLRIAGSKETQVFQWTALGDRTFVRAQVKMRGRVSVSGIAMLSLGWLDADHRHLGITVIRLPEGEWPTWIDLMQAGAPPQGAAWVGISIRIQHQAPDDWIEAMGFSLRGR